jgi:NB-ARC domain
MARDAAGHEVGVRQDTRAGQNAYTAGSNQAIINFGTSAGQAPEPSSVQRRVWGNVPTRNLGFTGRKRQLATLRRRLVAGDKTAVQALWGIGGVGKTQLAAEYAYQFAAEYDLVWWINAEHTGLIGEQFAALADELGCAKPGTEPIAVQRAALTTLHEWDRWLLVFDNAEEPEDVAAWLPGGNGHVLITSRGRGWDEIAVPVRVDVLARAESVAILRRRVPALTEAEAGQVAEALNDLPLAIAQAAGYMADTGTPAGEYVELLASRAAEIMDKGRPPSYPQTLAAVTRLAFERLRREDPAAAELCEICAFLAPWETGISAA